MKKEGGTSMSLTITKMSAKNVLKFVDFSVDCGKITKFKGANDQGKTSALRLAELALSGSTNPRVIHQGADKGEVTIELSDGVSISRTFTEKGQYPKVKSSEGHIIPKPQQYIDALLGEYKEHQFAPIAWLDLPQKEQVRILLRAIHVGLAPEEIEKLVGLAAPESVDYTRHGLEVLTDVREAFAAERKAENATVARLKGEADVLRAKLPETVSAPTEQEKAEALLETAAARRALASVEARALAAREHGAAVKRIADEIERELETIRAHHETIAKLNNEIKLATDRITARELEVENLSSSAPPTSEEMTSALADVHEAEQSEHILRERDRIADEAVRVDDIRAEAESHQATAHVLDNAVKLLSTEMPVRLMAKANLPVESLTIDGDRILVDGNDLQYHSTSRQIEISLAIARALNPKLKVIILDGFESLDLERREAFATVAAGDGYCYLISEVDQDGGPLTIETTPMEVTA